ncbi:MAG: hypothetical protein ACYDA8_20915 [Deferrisomatales bacterium]
MKESLLVFVNGTVGVFVGMGLVYALIKIVAAAVARTFAGKGDA